MKSSMWVMQSPRITKNNDRFNIWEDIESEAKTSRNEAEWSKSVSSVQYSFSIMPDSLWLHEPQHVRPPCPLPTPRIYSNSCPLSRWCNPTISSSVILFSSCFQSFPASGSFPVSQFFTSGGQSIEASPSASVLLMNIQNDFLLDWLVWSPCCPRNAQESSPTL